MTKSTHNFTNNMVINWHLLEPCQFKCKYCYAEWKKEPLPELYKNSHDSNRLLKELAKLKKGGTSVRISFAGGEPFLDKNLAAKIAQARHCGFRVSVITNGHLLNEKFLHENGKKISMLGVSIDSLDAATNVKIGRATISGKHVDCRRIISLLSLARKVNPHIRIKINTVVNMFNFNEDLSAFIDCVKPYKWKVLQVLPATRKSSKQAISKEKFETFKERHAHISCAFFEDNECMENSYMMIDPYGRFFFNKKDGEYGYSRPILDVGIEQALAEIDFDMTKFTNRYLQGVE